MIDSELQALWLRFQRWDLQSLYDSCIRRPMPMPALQSNALELPQVRGKSRANDVCSDAITKPEAVLNDEQPASKMQQATPRISISNSDHEDHSQPR